jgi:L-alanine-DL-glutamate epimerase-like enolase superfamily enzyme
MKITDIRFGMLRVPLKTPFKTALRTVDTIEDIVITMHTDTGHIGYGEAPATAVITGDTHGSIIEAIHKIIAPRIIGQEIANLNRITRPHPERAREKLQRQGRRRDRGVRPVRAVVRRAALQDPGRR